MQQHSGAAFEDLLARIVDWARGEEQIHSLMVIGSRARLGLPADEFSDLDLVLVTGDPGLYLSSSEWLESIDQPRLTFVEGTGVGRFLERRVLFAGGLDVDFAFIPVEGIEQILQNEIPQDIAQLIQRGVRVLLDKGGLAARLIQASPRPLTPRPPSAQDYLNLVNDFWYHAVWTAKKIGRGELWTAKMCADSYMKWLLLRMIEWNAHANRGWDHDTWHAGRFLERWAGPDVIAGLRQSFALYEEADLWRGLRATMGLFRSLAVETGQRLSIEYPAAGDEYASQLVEEIRCKA